VPLERTGRQSGSQSYSDRLRDWQVEGHDDMSFVIGGADGLDPSILARGSLVVSFGANTWPHMLARVMLVEQIYRAQQIIANHPYHRA
jgi:23S rRNA (pseudouridine1915-N3)-methyltransferase